MMYKGFEILPSYFVGSDFTIAKDGSVKARKPTANDIEYYVIYDPMENGKRWIAENTIAECKATIDAWLEKVGMKDNTPASWDKLNN